LIHRQQQIGMKRIQSIIMGKDKIKVVARDGIEPPTQGFSVL